MSLFPDALALDSYPVPGRLPWNAVLRADRVTLEGPPELGTVSASFAFPALGRPHFSDGGGAFGPFPPALPATAITVPSWPTPLGLAGVDGIVTGALTGHIGFQPTGGGEVLPATVEGGFDLGTLGRGYVATSALTPRTLYDVVVRGRDGAWHVVAPHAIYHKDSWADFGLIHVTDTHVARRIDGFRGALRGLGLTEAADRFINWNDRFRGFVRYANRLHDEGELDLLVATGDLFDYQYEVDDDPAGTGNAGFFADLLLGRAPGPDFPAVQELRVPVLATPGNHEYRRRPYDLVFDLSVPGDDVRVGNYSGHLLHEEEAVALWRHLYGGDGVPDHGADEAGRMVEVDEAMRGWRATLGDPAGHVAALGPHRVVLTDSGHDVGIVDSLQGGIAAQLGLLGEDEYTFLGGSPNCQGVSGAALEQIREAIASAPADGLVILGLHAPLVNLWGTEFPYFLRETQRAVQEDQVIWRLARHTDGLDSLDADTIKGRHSTWFARSGEPGPAAYVKRRDNSDQADFGVSRGLATEALRLVAGEHLPRAADLVLAGHTHRHNELVLRHLPDGQLAICQDYYTANPQSDYPTRFVTSDNLRTAVEGRVSVASNTFHYRVPATTTYVEVDADAPAGAKPWALASPRLHSHLVGVPPYARPLASTGPTTADKRAWWADHRPLLLQTAALGPLDNHQVSFAGFRLVQVRENVIQAIHFVAIEGLAAAGYNLPLAVATAPPAPRPYRRRERTRAFGSPDATGRPCVTPDPQPDAHSVIYRDRDGWLNQLWDVPGSYGASRLAGADVTPSAEGNPTAYLDPLGYTVVVYRGSDSHVHSLYWQSTEAAGHDALSASAGAPQTAGNPAAYALGGANHVVYRRSDGHLHLLWWTGQDAVSQTALTPYVEAPLAAGDPCAVPVTTSSGASSHLIFYRGQDDGIHSLYWWDGPTGHDALSGYAGSPPAAGEPVGLFTPHDEVTRVVYRGADGGLWLIWWVGSDPAQALNLSAMAASPPPAGDASVLWHPAGGRVHVAYRDTSGRVHDLCWPSGPGVAASAADGLVWTDITDAAGGPAAASDPVVFTTPGSPTVRVVYRTTDHQIHEIRWG